MDNLNIVDEIYRLVVRMSDDQIAGLTVNRLAKQFAVSRCHLSRRFHDERGMTLNSFIQRRKLLLAEHRLSVDPDITVKQLASSLGYADYQYFISCFKEEWGASPGRYRKLFANYAEEGKPIMKIVSA